MTDDWRPPVPGGGPPPPPPPPGPPPGPAGRPYGGGPPYGAGAQYGAGPAGGGRGRGRLVIVLGAVAAVAIVGLALVIGRSDDDSGDDPPPGVTLADLEPALLTLDDVGSDYDLAAADDDDDSEDALDADTVDASDECRTALGAFEASDATSESVEIDFEDEVDGTIQHSMSLTGDGQPQLADVRAALEECDTMTSEQDGAEITYAFDITDVDGPGDDAFGMTVAVDLSAPGYDLSFEMYGLMWQRDGVISSVAGFGGFDEEALEGLPPDTDEVHDLAAVADARLEEVLAG